MLLTIAPLVGRAIIAFGTSAPELVVCAVAAYRGNPALAVGNAIGSNMAYGIHGPGRISRRSGMLLIALYVAYQALIWVTAANSPRRRPPEPGLLLK